MTNRRGVRDERGAVAILVSLLAVVLLGVGALAVDVGEAYAKKSLLQTDVDLAVLAAAADLDNGGACNAEVVTTATDYLNKAYNKVPGQYTVDLGGSAGDDDGFISCDHWRVDLWAPPSHVDYGLGRILTTQEGVDVSAHASAQIKAATGTATLPFFAVSGCDNGPQSIRNDSGPSTGVPPLIPPTESPANNATFTISPDSTPSGTTSLTMTLTGSHFNNASLVGFSSASGAYFAAAITPTPSSSTTSFAVAVPTDVLATDDAWYVRVKIGDKWSPESEAQKFTVGPPKLYCGASNEGNFGTIKLPRSDTNSFPLEWNMIKGIEPTLAIHPFPNGECDGQPGSVVSVPGPVNGTNCVETEAGLKIAETNAGLVTGKGGLPGRLDRDSTSSCSRNHDSGRTPGTVKGFHINDDLLTCFITNGASIGNLVAGDVTGTEALSSDIYTSPRFFWVPVLATDPLHGTTWWPIVGRVPGFITDQTLSATHDAPGTITPVDGLVEDASGIREVHVVLFSPAALPEFAPTVGGEADYSGSGPKALVLVD